MASCNASLSDQWSFGAFLLYTKNLFPVDAIFGNLKIGDTHARGARPAAGDVPHARGVLTRTQAP